MSDAAGNRFVRFVGWIPPQSSARVAVSYSLPLPRDGAPYSLTLEPQAAIAPYTATVIVPGGEPGAFGPSPVDARTVVEVTLPTTED